MSAFPKVSLLLFLSSMLHLSSAASSVRAQDDNAIDTATNALLGRSIKALDQDTLSRFTRKLDGLEVVVLQNQGTVRLPPDATALLWPEGEPDALKVQTCVRTADPAEDVDDRPRSGELALRLHRATERTRSDCGHVPPCVASVPVPNTIGFSLGASNADDVVIERLTLDRAEIALKDRALQIDATLAGAARVLSSIVEVAADFTVSITIRLGARDGELVVDSVDATLTGYVERTQTLGTLLASRGLIEWLLETAGQRELNAMLAKTEIREGIRNALAQATADILDRPTRVVPGTFRFEEERLLWTVVEQSSPPTAPTACHVVKACSGDIRIVCDSNEDLLALEVRASTSWRAVGHPSSGTVLRDPSNISGPRTYRVCAIDGFSHECSPAIRADVTECGESPLPEGARRAEEDRERHGRQ